MLKVSCYPVGELQANCYFVYDTEQSLGFVVDPGAPSNQLIGEIETVGGDKLRYILLTHGHFDHIGYAAQLKEEYTDAKIVIGKGDSSFTENDMLNLSAYFGDAAVPHFKADIEVSDEDILPIGEKSIKVLSTPGHTRGGVCYIFEDIIFTGDTIMSMTTGRTDFPTGSSIEMISSAKKLAALDGNYKLYCGHGGATTLEYERNHNFAMR